MSELKLHRYITASDVLTTEKLEMTANTLNAAYPMQFYTTQVARLPRGMVPWHTHSAVEFITVVSGEATLHLPGKTFKLHEAEAYFVNGSVIHSVTADWQGECETIGFSCESGFVSAEASLLHQRFVAPLLENERVPYFLITHEREWMRSIVEEIQDIRRLILCGEWGYELEIRGRVGRIFALAVAHLSELEQASAGKAGQSVQRRLQQMCQFIQQNFASELSAKDIAEAAFISVSESERCFKRMLKTTPYQYLVTWRLAEAEKRLSYTEQAICEIASQCGFSNSSYFASLFVRAYGMLPSAYRQEQKKAKAGNR